jgi:hypothetical protein
MSKTALKKRVTILEQRAVPGSDKTIVIRMWQPDSYTPIESRFNRTRIVPFSKEECEAAEAEAIKNKGEEPCQTASI